MKNEVIKKMEAMSIINKMFSLGLDNSNTTFSNINSGKYVWWFDPINVKFNYDLHLLLNDQDNEILYYFFIKGGSIKNPEKLFRQRADRGTSHIEIRVGDGNFKDILFKKIQFKEYLMKKIKYERINGMLEARQF